MNDNIGLNSLISDKNQFEVSVVTVVLNDENNIENTIKSIIHQSYKQFEYIIIDGGSTDRTIEQINKYIYNVDIFISEKDEGLYDAMNKGATLANGKWTIFMNSGDTFHDDRVLEKIFSENGSIIDRYSVIYGLTYFLSNGRKKLRRNRPLHKIWCGMPASHQSILVRTNLLKMNRFSMQYKINADYDLIYKLYSLHEPFIYLSNVVISVCNADEGVSKTVDPKFTLRENFQVSKKYSAVHYQILLLCVNTMKYIYRVLLDQLKNKIDNRNK
jgi:glycosyltransferase involved in cell wall biosynthesis